MSRLRITGGVARGRTLKLSVGPGARPTSSRVREAVFSMVGQDLQDLRILDAFGGSGVMGLESWSRGARVTVVEKDRRLARAIAERGAELGADWTVKTGDVLRLAFGERSFHGVFADPPYALEATPILEVLARLADRWLVYEAATSMPCPVEVGGLELDRRKVYGGSAIHIYRRAQ